MYLVFLFSDHRDLERDLIEVFYKPFVEFKARKEARFAEPVVAALDQGNGLVHRAAVAFALDETGTDPFEIVRYLAVDQGREKIDGFLWDALRGPPR